MKLITEVLVLSLASIALFWVGRMYISMKSLTEFSEKYRGGIAGRRMRIILMLFGEKWGTRWMNLMGFLCILAGVFALGAVSYILLTK